MFCKFTGKEEPHQPVPDTVYWVDIKTTGFAGQLSVSVPGMFMRRYESFEEFQAEWEIV